MNVLVPPLAAIDADLIRLLAVIALLVLSGVVKLIASFKQAQQPQQPRPPIAPQRPPAKPKTANPVAGEIDEFLRRVAERGRRTGVEPVTQPKPQQSPAMPLPSSEKPVAAEAASEAPLGREVTEHVKKYLDEEEFDRRSAELGAEVVEVDREVDQHLHQTFDHTLSKLASVPGEAAMPPTVEPASLDTAAVEVPLAGPTAVVLALSNPQSICQAIVLNEILHRPEERWA